jgi:hypothetical protein
MSVTILFFFISTLFIATSNSVLSSALVEDSWNTKAPMSQARDNLGVVAVDSKIYAIGGSVVDADFVGINERYDPVTDVWTILTPMPTPRSQFTIVAYQSKIYCICGIVDKIPYNSAGWATGVTSNIVEVYDVVTDSWSTKASMPINMAGARASALNDNIFIVWGQDLFVYDILEDMWITKTDSIPSVPELCRIPSYVDPVVVDEKIMYVDAIQFMGETQKIMTYDPKNDAWNIESGDALLGGSSRGGGAVITSGIYAPQKIYAINLDHMAVYDLVDNTWTFAAIPTPRLSFGVAMVDDILYIIGGTTSEDIYNWYSYGKAIAINDQYIPNGYDNSNTSESAKTEVIDHSKNLITVMLLLIIGIVTMGTLVYFQKKKETSIIKTETPTLAST